MDDQLLLQTEAEGRHRVGEQGLHLPERFQLCGWHRSRHLRAHIQDRRRQVQRDLVRDGVKKSKWKFKMAFAMKGGGLEGVSSATYLF